MDVRDLEQAQSLALPHLGKYTILGRWAVGGMAEIYVARQTGAHGFDKLVALKLLRPELARDPLAAEMFFAEARTCALLSHPNIVQTFDAEEVGGRVYLAMEFVNGESLGRVDHTLRDHGGMGIELAAYVAGKVATALHYAHTLHDLHGNPLHLVHRDVSPSNIVLTHSGTVKLLDFGIAKVASAGHVTRAGVIKGKFAYLSPEQTQGGELDARSDVYALGLVLWQMLTGRQAHQADNDMALLAAIRDRDVPAPSTVNPQVPPELDAIVLKAVARAPEDRWADAQQMATALKGLLKKFPDFNGEEAIRGLMAAHFSERAEQLKKVVAASEVPHGSLQGLPHMAMPSSRSGLTPPGFASPYHTSPHTSPHFDPRLHTYPGMADPSLVYSPPVPPRASRWPWLVVGLVILLLGAGAIGAWVMMQPPADRTLVVSSQPEGAEVIVNGSRAGETPLNVTVQGDVAVSVTIRKVGWVNSHHTVKAEDEAPNVFADLQKAEEYGNLVVNTDPPGAEVRIDGQVQPGRTPALISNLWIGEPHAVVITYPGYTPVVRDINFVEQRSQEIKATLETSDRAFVQATCEPSPCDLYVDGESVGTTPIAHHPILPGRDVRVELRRGEEVVEAQTVNAAAGELAAVHHAPAEVAVDDGADKRRAGAAAPTRAPSRASDPGANLAPPSRADAGGSAKAPSDQGSDAGTGKVTRAPDAASGSDGGGSVAAVQVDKPSPEASGGDVERDKPPAAQAVRLSASIGSPQVSGLIDRTEVRGRVGSLDPTISRCYEQAYATSPFDGKLDVSFIVNSLGQARNVSVKGTSNKKMIDCITHAVGGVRFPESMSSDAIVKFSVRLKART